MLSSNRRFRPMGVSDILDETIELYKSSFVLLIGIAAIAYVPYFLVSTLLPQPPKVTDPSKLLEAIASQIPQFILFVVFALFLEPLVTGALTYAISEKYLSKETSIRECFGRVLRWRVFGSLVGATVLRYLFMLLPVIMMAVLAGFAVFAAFAGIQGGATEVIIALVLLALGALMLVPMVYFLIRFLVVAPTVVIEERGVIGALQRSWTLMRGSFWKAFGVAFVAVVIVLLVASIITGPTTAVIMINQQQGKDPSSFVLTLHMVLSTVVSTLTLPITSIVPILLYYDLRIRKEGFDLQMLAEELDHRTREMNTRDVHSLPQERIAPEQAGDGPIPDTQA